jgi:hypothetical protein
MEPARLRESMPLAKGATRVVFVHPADPDLLIKVMRPEFQARRQRKANGFNRFKRARMTKTFVAEMREQLILLGKGEDPDRFLQRVVGFCDTDLGLGMVVERVRGPDGGPAPSLKAIVRRGAFDGKVRDDLERFLETILASDITLDELNIRNLLYGADGDGSRRFVLVDGFGEERLIPFKGAIGFLNRRSKRRHIRRLRKQIEQARAAAAEKPVRRAERALGQTREQP